VRGPEANKEIGMLLATKSIGALVLRLIVGLALLGWPRVGAAQGSWSVISLPPKPGQVASDVAVDAAGNLYVVDGFYPNNRIPKGDAQGNWSVIATSSTALGQVHAPTALSVDKAGNLYVEESSFYGGIDRIQKRDSQRNCSVTFAER
jgi:hypothetical protein